MFEFYQTCMNFCIDFYWTWIDFYEKFIKSSKKSACVIWNKKLFKTCECGKKCIWKGAALSCVEGRCKKPENEWWPSGYQCFDADGTEYDLKEQGL